jgi:hypothetical protein
MRTLTLWASLLVLPLALLLCLQWPLREWLHAYSREANDLGQILFAVYVAVALYAASKARVHLAARVRTPDQAREPYWRAWLAAICLVPWALFILWSFWGTLWTSVLGLERFPETFNPGYFVLKIALALLLALVAWQAVRGVIVRQTKGSA